MFEQKPFDLCIAGEINLDLILYGLPLEMETERELLADRFAITLGSSSAIVAHNAAKLGARVQFVTAVGPDDFGRIALDRLQEAGVDLSATITKPEMQTGVTVMLPHGEVRHMLTYPGTIEALSTNDLDLEQLCRARHLHLSSLYLQKGLHAGIVELVRELKQKGLTISLDTNDDPRNTWGSPLQELLPYVDCLLPNESEVCRMTGTTEIEAALDALPAEIPVVVVKRGKHGARVRQGSHRFDVAPLTVTPIDTIGAGDSFDAGFLMAYLSGCDAATCARAGNITGALSTQATGGTEAFRDAKLRNEFLQREGFYGLVQQEILR